MTYLFRFLGDCDVVDEEDFESELTLMQELEYHPNVIRLLGICSGKRYFKFNPLSKCDETLFE